MGIVLVFVLGVANFAMHKAVLVSGHPLLGRVPWYFHLLSGRISLVFEFLMLLGAMLMVSQGSHGWGLFYLAYSGLNAVSAWLIITRRV